LRFLWFGSYAKGPGYPRSTTLIEGLRRRGHTVTELHAPLFAGAAERVRAASGGGLLRGGWRQTGAAARLGSGWFRASEHDVVVVGHGGVIDVPLARMLQSFERVPIVMDDFVPLYDAAVRDRALAPHGSLRARSILALERLSGRTADLVLADTSEHRELLARDLDVAPDRIAVVPIAQEDPGPPAPLPSYRELRVLLVATFIPLHGVETVFDAAGRLTDDPVHITVVGEGQGLAALRARFESCVNVELVPRFLPPDEIRERLARSHVGLGIFGDTPKASRVVPFKAVLTLAAGRALVTRDSPAAREALGPTAESDEPAALLTAAADGEALARALRALARDEGRVRRLAEAGRRRYLLRFTPERSADTLVAALRGRGLVGG
jgi:glycosyltransferase involved in cell wall biosynthesis